MGDERVNLRYTSLVNKLSYYIKNPLCILTDSIDRLRIVSMGAEGRFNVTDNDGDFIRHLLCYRIENENSTAEANKLSL